MEGASVKWLIVAGLSAVLVACGSQYDREIRWLAWYVGWNQIGSSQDYWLVKRSFGMDDPVALMFGYMDDHAGCDEIAQMLNQRYPSANYACRPAN